MIQKCNSKEMKCNILMVQFTSYKPFYGKVPFLYIYSFAVVCINMQTFEYIEDIPLVRL